MNEFIKAILGLATVYVPILGSKAHGPVERAFTLPEAKVRQMMGNASEEDKKEAVRLARDLADKASDFAVFVASKGKIDPD